MPLQRAKDHRAKLKALISRGVGITEIQKALGLGYADHEFHAFGVDRATRVSRFHSDASAWACSGPG